MLFQLSYNLKYFKIVNILPAYLAYAIYTIQKF